MSATSAGISSKKIEVQLLFVFAFCIQKKALL